jgi:protein-S-isoprenylcysteine O-methyltransferase Ste14
MKRLVNYLVHFHAKGSSSTSKIVSLFCGTVFFLVVLPVVFIWIGGFVRHVFSFELSITIGYLLSIVALVLGLLLLTWTTYFQLKIGKGTPAPNAPTQHLVITGPYQLCRNPIELGAIFYYLGIGTLYGGIVIGIICFILGVIIGSSYHKFIEEKELEIRFGDEYREYKRKTPFLFPKLRTLFGRDK